jgi:hypothetical protein
VEIGADLERVLHFVSGASGVASPFDPNLAGAQAPPVFSAPGSLAALSVHRGWSLCFAAQALFSVFNASPGFGGALHAENAILLAQMPVVIDKEFFQLLDKFLA